MGGWGELYPSFFCNFLTLQSPLVHIISSRFIIIIINYFFGGVVFTYHGSSVFSLIMIR